MKRTITIIGHRPKDLYGYKNKKAYASITKEVERILQRIKTKYSEFTVLTGGAQGVSMIAGSIAARTKGVTTKVCLPCLNIDAKWDSAGIFGSATLNKIISLSDEVKYLNNRAYAGPKDIIDRDHTMIDNSDIVVVVYKHDLNYAKKHRGSSTAACINYAAHKGKGIIHYNPNTGRTVFRKGVANNKVKEDNTVNTNQFNRKEVKPKYNFVVFNKDDSCDIDLEIKFYNTAHPTKIVQVLNLKHLGNRVWLNTANGEKITLRTTNRKNQYLAIGKDGKEYLLYKMPSINKKGGK